MTMALATLAQRYRLSLAAGRPPVEPLALITVQPHDGLPLIIEPRMGSG
jgi:cytochrome P450